MRSTSIQAVARTVRLIESRGANFTSILCLTPTIQRRPILYQPDDQRYLLLHPTLLDTISGEELTAFLLEMQSEIIKRYPALQAQRQEVFQALKSEFEDILASNMLDENQRSVLENLFYEPALAEKAAMVLSAHYAGYIPNSNMSNGSKPFQIYSQRVS